MQRRFTLFVLWLTLLSAVPGIAILSHPHPASAQEMHTVYLPWVPNEGTINGVGPWHGKLSFQNLSPSLCPSISIFVGGEKGWFKAAQLSLNAGATRTMPATLLAIPKPGAPVRLEAACPLAASVKEVTPNVRDSPWSDGASVVTGYTGISDTDVDTATASSAAGWFLPIVQTNTGWNTIIRIANLHPTTTTTARVDLYPNGNQQGSDGVTRSILVSIPSGGHADIDVLRELGVTGWVGFASITADRPVGVLAHRSKPSARMAITNVAAAADRSSTASRFFSSAPLLFTAYNGWNTGINLANVADTQADVTVRYYETGGSFIREENVILTPHSMQFLYTPGNVDQQGFVGSATIESSVPVIGAIDEVKYQTTEAMSYLASSVPQTDAAIPIVFREQPSSGRHDNSGINIANLNPNAEQTVEITLTSNAGASILNEPIQVTLPAGGSEFVYLPFVDTVPPGTVAAARLTTADPLGFVAVSNDVNYAVSGDGSVVFNAAGEQGLYRLHGNSVR